eukprot:gb/GECH01010589.1/.p1 GENE.gb/GECH01010589.1/~~gb/GECH01010589.1/.p1  ORF type:complete len:705 (+),score=219.90 gb/GECH01010589.1/:1-2115(+)
MEPLSPNSREWISNTNSPKQDEVPPSQHDQRMGTHYSSTSAGYLHHPSNGSHPTSFEYNTHPPPNDYYGDIQGHTVPTSSLGEHSPQGQQPSDPRRSPIYHISTPEPPKQPQQRGYNPEPSMAGTNYFNPSKHSSHSYQQQQPPASFNPMAPRMASNSVNSPSTPIHDDRSSQDQFIPGSNSDPYFHDNSNPATFSSSSTIDQNLPSSTPEYCDNRSHHYMKSHHSSLAQDQIQPTAPPSPPSPFSSSNYSSSSQDYRASSVPQHSQPPINHQHSINPGSHPSYPSAQPSPSLPSVNFHGDYGNHFEDRSRAFSPNVYNPPDIPLHLNGSSNYPSSASAPRHQYPEQNTYPSHPSSNFPPHYPTNKDNPYHVDSPQNYPHYLYQDHPQNYSYSGESFAHSHKPEELLSPHHNIQDPRLSRFRNDPQFLLNQTRSSHSYNHVGMYDQNESKLTEKHEQELGKQEEGFKVETLAQEESAAESNYSELEKKLEQIESSKNSIKEEKQKMENQIENMKQEKESLSFQLHQVQIDQQNAEKEMNTKEHLLKESQKEIELLKNELMNLKQENFQLKNPTSKEEKEGNNNVDDDDEDEEENDVGEETSTSKQKLTSTKNLRRKYVRPPSIVHSKAKNFLKETEESTLSSMEPPKSIPADDGNEEDQVEKKNSSEPEKPKRKRKPTGGVGVIPNPGFDPKAALGKLKKTKPS